jgi:hypothetical protein
MPGKKRALRELCLPRSVPAHRWTSEDMTARRLSMLEPPGARAKPRRAAYA